MPNGSDRASISREEARWKYRTRPEKERRSVIPAIESGFFARETADAAFRYQQEVEKRERIIVGLNEYKAEDTPDIPTLKVDPQGEEQQLHSLKELRRERDNWAAKQRLRELHQAAKGDANMMPCILEALRAYATLGEVCAVLKEVFGEYTVSRAA